MTLLSVVTDVFLQLKETKGTDLFWVESEVIAALNDTYYEIAETTRCFKASSVRWLHECIRRFRCTGGC